MSKRVVVGYATGTGTTTGVAEVIGQTLEERGFAVDVKPFGELASLDDYDACVLGSAVNGGRWLPQAMAWLESHKSEVSGMPAAVFCVHSMNGGENERHVRKRLAYLDTVRPLVTPVAEGYFLGKGPTAEDTSRFARWAFKAFGGTAEGDARDWNKIRAWAEGVPL